MADAVRPDYLLVHGFRVGRILGRIWFYPMGTVKLKPTGGLSSILPLMFLLKASNIYAGARFVQGGLGQR